MIPPAAPFPHRVSSAQERLWPLLAVSLVAPVCVFVLWFLRSADASQSLANASSAARAANEQEKFQATLSKVSLAPSDNFIATDESQLEPRLQPDPLPREKRELLQKIATDYDELSQPIYTAVTGVIPRENREELTLLDQEKITDLAAVLNPAELDAYHYLSSRSVPLRRR